MWNLKYDTNKLIYKVETDSQAQKQTYGCKEVGGRGGMDWGFGISRQKLVYRGRINNKVLPYSTGKYSQNPGIDQNGKYESMCIYVNNWIILLYRRNEHNIVNQLYFNKSKK